MRRVMIFTASVVPALCFTAFMAVAHYCQVKQALGLPTTFCTRR